MILVALLVGVAAYFACFLLPKGYRGVETLYFPMAQAPTGAASALGGLISRPSTGEAGNVGNLNGALTSPLVGSGPQTAIGIVLSKGSIDDLISAFDLQNRWHETYIKTYLKVQSSLSAGPDRDTGFVKVAYESTDKELAVEAVREALHYLSQRSDQLSVNVSRSNRKFVESRLDQAKKTRLQREAALVQASKRIPITSSELVERSYWDFRTRIVESESALAGAKARINDLRNHLSQTFNLGVNATANDALSQISRELATRRLALEDARTTFRTNTDEVKKAKTELSNAERVAKAIRDDRANAVKSGAEPSLAVAYAEAASLEATVAKDHDFLNRLELELFKAPGQAAEIHRLRTDLATAEEAVARLEQELAQAKVAEERDPSRFEVIDPAALDPEYTSPKKALYAGIAFAIALALQALPYLRRLVVFES
jgi:uncharacterized protein involved in exopolysaccharide biosynthesis